MVFVLLEYVSIASGESLLCACATIKKISQDKFLVAKFSQLLFLFFFSCYSRFACGDLLLVRTMLCINIMHFPCKLIDILVVVCNVDSICSKAVLICP